MNKIFNLNRMGLLIQRYFVENSRRELFYWGMITLIFMFCRNNPELSGLFIIIFGAIYASRFFKEIHSKTNGANYFMISANQLEKVTTGILFCIVYFFGMMMISYVVGNLIGTFLNNLLAKIPLFSTQIGLFNHSSLEWVLFEPYVKQMVNGVGVPVFHETVVAWNIFKGFIICQSIFLFGGLYFKNNPLPKIVGSLFLFFLGITVLIAFEVWIFNGFKPEGSIIHNFEISWNISDTIENIFAYLLAPFFWVTSYFRLTEKEV